MITIAFSPNTSNIAHESIDSLNELAKWLSPPKNDQGLISPIEIKKTICFHASDVKNILLGDDCQHLVLVKKSVDGHDTLALIGVDSNNNLVLGSNPAILIGNYFEKINNVKHGADKGIPLDFTRLNNPETEGTWGAHNSIVKPSGTFKTQIENFQEKPYNFNLFATVNFESEQIRNLLNDVLVERLAFIPGFASLTNIETIQAANDMVEVKTNTPIEILIGFAVDKDDSVIGDPAIPFSTWPREWPPYTIQ